MADQVEYAGRLIAIDGTRGKDTAAAAEAVVAALKDRGIACAVSRFDASGLFGELASAGRGDRSISARTLALVYAADLAFRLRWEIRPVLQAGGVVIAAPYVETAVAAGAAYGLDEHWIQDLLRFAPKPHFRGRAAEKKIDKGWKGRLNRGYGEYCAAMLRASTPKSKAKQARAAAMSLLHRRGGRKPYQLVADGVAALTTAITGSPPAGRPRSARPPRSARSRRARR